MVVYTCDVEISFEKFSDLSDSEKFSRLLTGATADTVVQYIKVRITKLN